MKLAPAVSQLELTATVEEGRTHEGQTAEETDEAQTKTEEVGRPAPAHGLASDCPSCRIAAKDPTSRLFNSNGCLNCTARQLASGMELFEMQRMGNTAPMYAALRLYWGEDNWKAGKELVAEWAEKIKGAKAK